MASKIDVTQPTGTRVKSADTRANWQTASDEISALQVEITKLMPIAGGQMTGPLILATGPMMQPLIASGDVNDIAVHKSYVDDAIAAIGGGEDGGYLPLVGGTLTGPLFLMPANPAAPLQPNEAVNKRWLDWALHPPGVTAGDGSPVAIQGGSSSDALAGTGGRLSLTGGQGRVGGYVNLYGGMSIGAGFDGGAINLQAGRSLSGRGGNLALFAGDGTSGGSITLRVGNFNADQPGMLSIFGLPTVAQTDPSVVWDNAGVLNIGAGGAGGGGGSIDEPVGLGAWGRLETGLWEPVLPLTGGAIDGTLELKGLLPPMLKLYGGYGGGAITAGPYGDLLIGRINDATGAVVGPAVIDISPTFLILTAPGFTGNAVVPSSPAIYFNADGFVFTGTLGSVMAVNVDLSVSGLTCGGVVVMRYLPTVAQAADTIWNNNGTLNVGAGSAIVTRAEFDALRAEVTALRALLAK